MSHGVAAEMEVGLQSIIVRAEVAAEIHDYSFVHEVKVNIKVANEAKHAWVSN